MSGHPFDRNASGALRASLSLVVSLLSRVLGSYLIFPPLSSQAEVAEVTERTRGGWRAGEGFKWRWKAPPPPCRFEPGRSDSVPRSD